MLASFREVHFRLLAQREDEFDKYKHTAYQVASLTGQNITAANLMFGTPIKDANRPSGTLEEQKEQVNKMMDEHSWFVN